MVYKRGKFKGRIRLKFKKRKLMHHLLDNEAKRLNDRFQSVKEEFRLFVRGLVMSIIYNSTDSNNIRNTGFIRGELGIPKGEEDAFVTAVAERVAKSTLIRIGKIRRVGLKIGGAVSMFIIQADYSDVLAIPEATITTKKGDKLPIVKWILTAGDVPILQTKGYRYKMKKAGRSGEGVMLKSKNNDYFKIHSSYSGVVEDNWLTRAFNEGKQMFIAEIKDFIQKRVLK